MAPAAAGLAKLKAVMALAPLRTAGSAGSDDSPQPISTIPIVTMKEPKISCFILFFLSMGQGFDNSSRRL
jgi:hypothetical protein